MKPGVTFQHLLPSPLWLVTAQEHELPQCVTDTPDTGKGPMTGGGASEGVQISTVPCQIANLSKRSGQGLLCILFWVPTSI